MSPLFAAARQIGVTKLISTEHVASNVKHSCFISQKISISTVENYAQKQLSFEVEGLWILLYKEFKKNGLTIITQLLIQSVFKKNMQQQ